MSSIRYTYTDEDNGSIVFGTDQVENWSDTETNLTRSQSYRGRVRKVTNTFNFVDTIRNNYVMKNFGKNKTNAKADFLIEVGDDNFDEFSFTPLGSGFPMVADFNSYKVTENAVELNFVDSEFQQRITSGEKEKLNITTPNVLGDKDTLVTDYTTLLKTISMHDRELEFNTVYEKQNTGTYRFPDAILSFYVPLEIKATSDPDSKNTFRVDGFTEPEIYNVEHMFYLKAEKNRTLNFNLSAKGRILSLLDPPPATTDWKLRLVKFDSDDIFKEYITIIDDTFDINPVDNYGLSDVININYSQNIDLLEGESIGLFSDRSFSLSPDDFPSFSMTYSTIDLFQRTTSNCILPHEFFTHWIEIMTGRKNAFHSNYFGRTDLGYDQDGEGAYLAIMDGHMIRNLDIEENPLNVSFKDMVEDFIKLKNLVAGVKYIGDTEVFSIEKYTDFYGTNAVADLGDVINDIELEVNEELTYSKINVGTKDLELEDLLGLDSPHGEVNYSTPLDNIDKELDLVLKSILNDYAIEQTRRKQSNISSEEDTKNDKKIFIIDSKPWSTTDVIAKTNEGYTSITGVLSPDKIYNIDLVPSEQVRLWGNVINGCLQAEQDGQLTLTKSASNNTLVREKDNGDIITEKDNIPVNTLDTALIINENIIVSTPLQKVTYDIIENDPNGLYKLAYKGVDFYSYIDLLAYNVSEKNANFTLNRSTR